MPDQSARQRSEDAHKPPVIFLMGATATGKTELAVQLVEELPCDIVSVDSVMVYRGLDIGSAKPDEETLARAPHRLIDICDPVEVFSAAQFRERALAEITDIHAAGRIPLLTGGTMLYFRTLEQGLAPLPSADAALRAQLEEEATRHGWPAMHRRLAEVDPAAAARIHSNDPQRIQRALEVYELTGETLSNWLARETEQALPFRVIKLTLMPPSRDVLRARIAHRFLAMLKQGLVAEVDVLYRRGDLHAELPAIRAVGYRQVWNYLAGTWDYETMVERGIIATRQFAKRQLTWLRRESGGREFEVSDQLITLKTRDLVLNYLASNAIW